MIYESSVFDVQMRNLLYSNYEVESIINATSSIIEKDRVFHSGFQPF
jgi:hypothetical protein